MEKFYKKREKEKKEKKKLNDQKKEQIQITLLTQYKEHQNKNKLYFERQIKLDEEKLKRAKSKDLLSRRKLKDIDTRYLTALENRNNLEIEEKKRKSQILEKMDEIDIRLKKRKKYNDYEYLKKQEEAKVKKYEKDKLLERLNNQQIYKNKKRLNELKEKEKRQENYQKQKSKMEEKRQEISEKIQKEKQNVINKFDKLMKQNKEIEPQIIKELFPDDEELYIKIKSMIDQKKKILNEENQKKNNEKNIQKKIEEYKNKLQRQLNDLIQENKIKENERIQRYENAKNDKEKLMIENNNQKERIAEKVEIDKLKDVFEQKIKNYENLLRNNN